ncbi:MAG: DUF86 domain-containing protein [Cytophagales bacterium]|nr:DUF86 domain-containing protein [Cytophagales bacterium]MCA6366732.1 DUF86 domain-containing protein [Cytophagales bacterium]MCA6372745.1 DUF86 domain-containing protein [Cytophagales bacterium]MCA6377601.1 DUF86 domain-containing protein [Cytophagales bacterium]MCA6384768.1 DUF86 domain-containing protein [Cytophagales bacterium]
MSFLSEKDAINLRAIADSVRKIENFVTGIADSEQFRKDEKTFDSVLMNFVVIGESVERLTDDFKKTNTEIHWGRIKSFRNLVAHNYFGIDSEEVWQLIHTHLPVLKQYINKILV